MTRQQELAAAIDESIRIFLQLGGRYPTRTQQQRQAYGDVETLRRHVHAATTENAWRMVKAGQAQHTSEGIVLRFHDIFDPPTLTRAKNNLAALGA